MSFSRRVKEEIIGNKSVVKHYSGAALLGLFCCCNSLNASEFKFASNNKNIVNYLAMLINKHAPAKIKFSYSTTAKTTELTLADSAQAGIVLDTFKKVKDALMELQDQQSFIAGVFLACGSVTNPAKSYHLEFVLPTQQWSELIEETIATNLNVKTTIRKGKKVIYCKESGEITDALTMIGATTAALEYIEAEMLKGVMNNANRITNFETANIDKTVTAATSQVDDITYLLEHIGDSELSDQLLETARIRLDNPYSSLRELAQLFSPPISRSGLHHRLVALTKHAQQLRNINKEEAYD